MPRYRALLIGNALYLRDPELRTLKGPSADVAALFAALTDADTGLFDPDAIEPLIDRGVQDLREKVHQFLVEDATRDDILLLYYSGHGRLDLTSRLHLCAIDTRTSALRPTTLRYAEDIEAAINESPAASVVTVLDCCYSGAFRGDGEIMVEATGSGRCVMTSASATQLALDETRDGSPSPFTEAFVNGLREAEAQGHLTTQQLYDYISREIRGARPQFRYDGEGSIALARRSAIAPPQKPRATAPVAPSQAPNGGIALPLPNNHIERLLNKAASTALTTDGGHPDLETLHGLLRRSIEFGVTWPKALLASMPVGEPRLLAVKGYAAGLAALGPLLRRRFDWIWQEMPERILADLAFVEAAAPELSNDAEMVLRETFLNDMASERDRFVVRGRATLIALLVAADFHQAGGTPVLAEFPVRLLEAADSTDFYFQLGTFNRNLVTLIESEPDLKDQQILWAEAALRIASADARLSLRYFSPGGELLPFEAFADLAIDAILTAATALLSEDPRIAYRLFRIAEERCRTATIEVDLLAGLVKMLTKMERPQLLVPEIERAAAPSEGGDIELLVEAAMELAERAPEIAERLLRLEPNEDYRRFNLVKAAEQAAESNPAASRRMLTAAERLAHSVTDPILRDAEILGVAEGYAAVDPERAVQMLRSPTTSTGRRQIALTQVARVFASRWPDRIDSLVSVAAESDRAQSIGSVAEGLADQRPDLALQLADTIDDPLYRGSVLKEVVLALITDAPERAFRIALSIEVPGYQTEALLALVEAVAPMDPRTAMTYLGAFPRDVGSQPEMLTAFASVVKHLQGVDREATTHLLTRAEAEMSMIDDHRFTKGLAVVALGEAAAGFDLGRASALLATAESWALGRADSEDRDTVLSRLAVAWATVAPRRAEEVVKAISADWEHLGDTIGEAVRAMADIDSRTAERVARTIADEDLRNRTLARLAVSLSGTSPVQAEAIADSLPPSALKVDALLTVAEALHRE
jgi:hypothetical protein